MVSPDVAPSAPAAGSPVTDAPAPARIRLILASASPARLATLRSAGLHPEVVVSGVDESVADGRAPAEMAVVLAELKARAVAVLVGTSPRDGGAAAGERTIIVGCDSVLDLDGRPEGKPGDAATARARLAAMRGTSGVLHTGHCVIDLDSGRRLSRVASTTVRVAADLTDREIADYVATGEPLWVAGSFTIDGFGGAFIDGIDGDPHNVVGISLPLLRRMFREFDIHWPDLWRRDPLAD